jgi:hypothetical protein
MTPAERQQRHRKKLKAERSAGQPKSGLFQDQSSRRSVRPFIGSRDGDPVDIGFDIGAPRRRPCLSHASLIQDAGSSPRQRKRSSRHRARPMPGKRNAELPKSDSAPVEQHPFRVTNVAIGRI